MKVEPRQQEYLILRWAEKNIVVVSVYMTLVDHVKRNLDRINSRQCILKRANNSFLMCTNKEALLQGAYLYFDANLEEWIRSGKQTGEKGMGGRNTEHVKRAESDTNPDDSRFYNWWPSIKSERAVDNPVRQGYFEDLVQYVAAGFNPTEDVLDVCCKDYVKESGIFFYSAEEKRKISGINFRGRTDKGKFMEAIAYLFELGYDLALSREFNVSRSPGFEGFGLRKIDEE